MASVLMMCALIIEAVVLLVLVGRILRLEHSFEDVRRQCEVRLDTLKQLLLEESGNVSQSNFDDQKKALEAERRFTEGVANILSFSCNTGGRTGE